MAVGLGLFFCSSPALFAQPLLLKNAIVHTVSGGTLSPGSVLLNHGKIEAVGSRIDAPADAQILDLKGQHLYPGMIALDSALGLNEIEGVRATQDTTEVGEFHPDVEAWIAVNPDSELIPVTRVNGITHAEPAPQGGVVAGLSGVVALDGWTVEQMTIKRPAALHVYWPGMDLDITPPRGGRGRGAPAPGETKPLEEQARDRQTRLKAVDDFFLEARAYAKARAAGKAALNPPWEAMLPVVHGDIPVMVHAHDLRQIKAAVKWAQTNDYKIIIVGGQDAWKAATLLASRQVPVIYESVFELPGRDSEAYDINFKSPEQLREAGVKVAFSVGAGGMSPAMGRNLPYFAAQAVAFGFPADEALKGITLYPAQMLGVADRLGSLEPGKEASLFACDGEIFDLRANVKHLWIAGKEIDLSTRHTRLYEKYKNRPLSEARSARSQAEKKQSR